MRTQRFLTQRGSMPKHSAKVVLMLRVILRSWRGIHVDPELLREDHRASIALIFLATSSVRDSASV